MAKSDKEIANISWVFTEQTWRDGKFDCEQIQTAAATASYKQLVRISDQLERIAHMLASLGNDGIHEVIREAKAQSGALRTKRIKAERRKKLRRVA